MLTNPDYADFLDADMQEMLTGAKTITDAVVSGEKLLPSGAYQIMSALTNELDENMVNMLYFYKASLENSDPSWTLSVEQVFHYLCDYILDDPRFSPFLEDDMRSALDEIRVTLDDGIEMLKADRYSRLIIYTSLPAEGESTTAFLSELNDACDSFSGEHYLIGNSAMNYKMEQTFDEELQKITLLTSIAIFLIVLFTFRNLAIPLILVLLVQCSVYITVTLVGIQGYSIYFLALLIVECILMGSTIDYGILFTNYYRENKKRMPAQEAISAAYNGSIHTIMTSGLIMVLVTGIIGYTASDPTLAQIVRTISTGALCAILMILFILPGMLAGLKKI